MSLGRVGLGALQAALNLTFGLTELLSQDPPAPAGEDIPEPSLAELRGRTPGVDTAESPERPRLTRPDGAAPEEFYPRVVAAYAEYAPQTRAPAREIATEAGVPVTTAHRWIREARRRGFLPLARKGKAG